MWKKKSSINFKILFSFLIFSCLLMVFLWLFQVSFLGTFYRSVKTKDIRQVGNYIKTNQNKENFASLLEDVSFEKEVCIEVTNQSDSLFEANFFGKGCLRNGQDKVNFMQEFIESGQKEKTYIFQNPRFNNDTLMYAIQLDNNRYAFINTSLEPIDSTASIIRRQLIIVTIIVLLLSFIISWFISKHLSKPIVTINEQAKKMANGDFSCEFDDHSSILEINELSDTLNYAREELCKTDELRRDLIANVSHDLKTPLTMIKAYAEMSMDLHSDKPEKQREDMEIIVSEADRLTLLVRDILDLSKMQSSIDELKIEDFDIIQLTENILKRYQLYQETEDYQFVFEHRASSILVSADKIKIEQVIYNLINNAINYTGDDNKVVVSIQKKKDIVRVSVKDSGKGIKEEELPHIWDRYYKNKKKHKRNLVGTGLGLSIVKNILESHGFFYGVDTKLNHGTTFYFEMNVKQKED